MLRLHEPGTGTPIYQLKIVLNYTKPFIWRRVLVPANLKLNRLHTVIQRVMPWTDSHLHQFVVGETFYGVPDREYMDDMGPKTLNETKFTLAGIAPEAKSAFIYEYDFGDSWEHSVIVEKVLPADPEFKHPVCLAGENACPPDDCGGIPGYYEMLKVLRNPKHEEYESMKEWVGGEWNAERFDLAQVNKDLKRLKA